jgi:hypothetical protein
MIIMIVFFIHNPSHQSITQTYMWDRNYVEQAKEVSNFSEIYGHKAFHILLLNFHQLVHHRIVLFSIHYILTFNLKN